MEECQIVNVFSIKEEFDISHNSENEETDDFGSSCLENTNNEATGISIANTESMPVIEYVHSFTDDFNISANNPNFDNNNYICSSTLLSNHESFKAINIGDNFAQKYSSNIFANDVNLETTLKTIKNKNFDKDQNLKHQSVISYGSNVSEWNEKFHDATENTEISNKTDFINFPSADYLQVEVGGKIFNLKEAVVILKKLSIFEILNPSSIIIKRKKKNKNTIFHKQYSRYCPQCNSIFKNIPTRNPKTCQRCNTVLLYQCGKCEMRFKNYDHLKYHVEVYCQPQKFEAQCSDCLRKYDNSIKYRDHRKRCSRPIQFKCDKCDFATKFKKSFISHTSFERCYYHRHRGMRNKTDHSEINLLGLYNRYCPQCDEIIKNTEKKYSQCRKCNIKLLFKCVKCDWNCDKYINMFHHIKRNCNNSQVKYTVCHHCSKNFPSKDSLKRHLIYCALESKFNCSDCTFETKYQHSLRRHINLMHSKNDQ